MMTAKNSLAHSMPNPDNITRAELENGVIVLVYENPATRSVVLSGLMHGGAIYEDRTYNGVAALTAGLLMRGTQTRGFQTLAATLEDIGADFGAGAGTHHVNFGGKALAEDLPVLVDVMADVLRNPVFPAAQVEKVRGETITGLMYALQDTRRQASRAFRETLYDHGHPYHYAARGTLDTVPNITADMLRQFHAEHYGPRGMIVVIAGAVKAAEAVDLVREKLGNWSNPGQPDMRQAPNAPQPSETARAVVPIAGKTQSDVVLGVVGPSRYAEEFQAARLANSVLGEFGMMGRIGDEVREKSGMAYYAYSRLEGGHGPGAWLIAAGVNPVNVERAIDLSINEARKLVDTLVTEEELADNQSYFTGRLPLQLETNEGIAGSILNMETFGLGLDYLVRLPGIFQSLTREQLREAVRRYWSHDAVVIGVAGPEA